MAHLFDIPVIKKNPILVELADDLEGTLHVIAHAGKAGDRGFIEGRQAALRKDYGSHVNGDSLSLLDYSTFLECAYHNFLHVLDGDPTEEEIAQECENILYDDVMPEC
jgi:hypothetical protein